MVSIGEAPQGSVAVYPSEQRITLEATGDTKGKISVLIEDEEGEQFFTVSLWTSFPPFPITRPIPVAGDYLDDSQDPGTRWPYHAGGQEPLTGKQGPVGDVLPGPGGACTKHTDNAITFKVPGSALGKKTDPDKRQKHQLFLNDLFQSHD